MEIEEIEKKIQEEKTKPNKDQHKIYRLMEQETINDLFDTVNFPMYAKYRSPW